MTRKENFGAIACRLGDDPHQWRDDSAGNEGTAHHGKGSRLLGKLGTILETRTKVSDYRDNGMIIDQ
jgi:hypothetical protein